MITHRKIYLKPSSGEFLVLDSLSMFRICYCINMEKIDTMYISHVNSINERLVIKNKICYTTLILIRCIAVMEGYKFRRGYN